MQHLSIHLHLLAARLVRRADERGATAVEYALMVGLIAVGIIGAVSLLGSRIGSTFDSVGNTLG